MSLSRYKKVIPEVYFQGVTFFMSVGREIQTFLLVAAGVMYYNRNNMVLSLVFRFHHRKEYLLCFIEF